MPRVLGATTSEGMLLVVPAEEEQAARARGVQWDPDARRWYVPVGREVAIHRFRRWIDQDLDHVDKVDDGPYVSAAILCLAQDCYRCHNRTGPIVGVLVDPQWCLDPEGFIPFDLVAEELADAIDGESFLDFGTGLLKWRRSRQVPEGYVSNGCHHCDTILGSWRLGESLARYRAQGGPMSA